MLDTQFAGQDDRPAGRPVARRSRASSSARWAWPPIAPKPARRPARRSTPWPSARRCAPPTQRAADFVAQHTEAAEAGRGARAASRPPSWWRRPRTKPAGAAARSGRPTARNSFNLFGIKAGADWKGADGRGHDHRVRRRPAAARWCRRFRAYSSYAESFADYARLMKNSPRYRDVVAERRQRAAASRRACSAPATPPTRPTPTSSAASSTPRCACSARRPEGVSTP